MNIIKIKLTKQAIALSKDQRRHKWKTEMIFKERLERERIKFIWQHPIVIPNKTFYSLDFYLPKIKLCIELDGSGHKKNRDLKRDRNLKSIGIKTIRFKNSEVKNNINNVIKEIAVYY